MSVKIMAQVWELELSHSQQAVLLAMADYANDDGANCRPSYRRLAWKTGYSERQVARAISDLVGMELVKVIHEATNSRPARYQIQIAKGSRKAPYVALGGHDVYPRDDTMSTQVESGVDMVSSQTALGRHHVHPGVDMVSTDPPMIHQTALGEDWVPFPEPKVDARVLEHNRHYSEMVVASGELFEVGVSEKKANALAATHGLAEIRRQVAYWKPEYEAGRAKAGLLVHRIERRAPCPAVEGKGGSGVKQEQRSYNPVAYAAPDDAARRKEYTRYNHLFGGGDHD